MTLFTARRLQVAAVAAVLGSMLFGAAPANAAAAPTLTSRNLAATVKGFDVTTTTTLSSSASTLVAKFGVCARGADKANFDFVKAQNVTVTPAGYTQTTTQTLPAGTYSYWTCAYYDGAWLTLDSAKPFVVSSTPPVDGPDIVSMPKGDLLGWKQVFTDDFSTNAATGTFGDVYKNKFSTYHGFPDSYNGGTYNKNILSVNNGVLDMFLHKENGRPQVAAPAPIVTQPWAGQTYGKFSVRFKSDALSGYKTAWLLWPDSNNWSQGEIDFPEGGLNGTMWAFNHCVGTPTKNCSWVDTQTRYDSWHTLSLEWTPSRVTYLIDGQVVGNDTKNIPSNPMHWVLQTETTSATANTQDGHLQIDWISVYTYSPGTTGAAPVTTTAPVTTAPVTTAPVTTAPVTTVPVTPAPAPVTTAPVTTAPAPVTTAPVTTAPVTTAPVTTVPVTPAPAPVTTAPVTTAPAPVTTAPVTTAPVTPAPAPVTTPTPGGTNPAAGSTAAVSTTVGGVQIETASAWKRIS